MFSSADVAGKRLVRRALSGARSDARMGSATGSSLDAGDLLPLIDEQGQSGAPIAPSNVILSNRPSE